MGIFVELSCSNFNKLISTRNDSKLILRTINNNSNKKKITLVAIQGVTNSTQKSLVRKMICHLLVIHFKDLFFSCLDGEEIWYKWLQPCEWKNIELILYRQTGVMLPSLLSTDAYIFQILIEHCISLSSHWWLSTVESESILYRDF